MTSEALLLHDIVPGGTGYLAELATPARMRDLLYRAWGRSATAPARPSRGSPATAACCRSPRHAGHINSVSRLGAERHLRAILTRRPEPCRWNTEPEAADGR